MKKILISGLFQSLIIIILTVCIGCDSTTSLNNETEKEAEHNFVVKFESNGGSEIDSVIANEFGDIDEPEHPLKEGYVFNGWYKENLLENLWDFREDEVESDMTLYAGWHPVETGVKGPGGGWIFYDKGYYSDNWRYLEVSSETLVYVLGAQWGTVGIEIPGAEGTAVGSGLQNTLDIVNGDPKDDTAADECYNYTANVHGRTYDDWYLPSDDELFYIIVNLKEKEIGNMPEARHWSSTEVSDSDAHFTWYFNGTVGSQKKDTYYKVRAVRQF
jgi:uncharacterized repeat protein (TIGR02543 family)